jgi:hypothetical protein
VVEEALVLGKLVAAADQRVPRGGVALEERHVERLVPLGRALEPVQHGLVRVLPARVDAVRQRDGQPEHRPGDRRAAVLEDHDALGGRVVRRMLVQPPGQVAGRRRGAARLARQRRGLHRVHAREVLRPAVVVRHDHTRG